MKNFWRDLNFPILAMAPMVGITDSAWRRLVKSWGADVVYSEMIASEALIRGAYKALKMMDFEAAEQPFVVQLMGNKPEVMAQAAKLAAERGAAGIDINFGCPANKIAKNYCGVMLMRDLELSHQIIEAVIKAVAVPVSLKVRTSINCQGHNYKNKDMVSILEFLEHMQDMPIAAVMIHGRSFEAPFDGDIDHQMIREAKKIFTNGPLLANGGVATVEDAGRVLELTQADGLGLARCALGKPWVFKQIKEYLATGSYKEVGWQETKEAMLEHARLFYKFYGQDFFKPMRRHLAHYTKGLEKASEIRQQLVRTNSPQEVAEVLSNH